MNGDVTEKIFAMEFERAISHEQGYRLRQLAYEGIDISVGLEGRIDGIRRCVRMAGAIREGDDNAVRALIEETRSENEAEKAIIEQHLSSK